MKKGILSIIILLVFVACKSETKDNLVVVEEPIENKGKSTKELKEELLGKGFELFDYVDEKTQDTVIMQKYFIAFLKKGPNRSQPEEEANKLQAAHMAHLGKMYELGYADISGPFEDDSDISGITIYNVPTLQMADSLANADPMVKAGRLVIEMHPWWAAKGFPLR
ncbi:YciI family protein [Flavobacteriaceae bacterium S0825]|uniref:YciI family protein n=1 Tax=Gaetbulibacter sp. S0825 TaxID=2720084 RepID=UPI0014319B9A|nr:YciI family protein [Gaetbulibacter sp. S0825]MCK0108162.1 YciI family protein [Flavobacteriaceae bacterium S0825]NIX63798.1 hypothetical protein [Gaetbulibacter sp. S0825]